MPPSPSPQVVVVTGASSGFGAMAVRALARAGHTVYAGIRDTSGRNASVVADLAKFAAQEQADVQAVDLDVTSQDSADAAIAAITGEQGRLDVVVHNAGHMVLGPAEAFTAEQVADIYDVNVLGTQRVNRAALPRLREQGSGLLVWVGSSSTRGGCPPFLGPYFAAKAAMDSLAVSYAAEVIRFGIDTTIVVPGAYTTGTNHFAHAGQPGDTAVAKAYDARYAGLTDEVSKRLAGIMPEGADPARIADVIAELASTPPGQRPFRVTVDPSKDGSEVVSVVADRIRADFFRRIGLDDLLTEHASR